MKGKAVYSTSIGNIEIAYEENTVTELKVINDYIGDGKRTIFTDIVFSELEEYFLGLRKDFDFSYKISGTKFEMDVLECICNIPYGETVSYGKLAEKIGRPGAARAVGTVCRKNRILFIIPCHRVIKSDGNTGEYACGKELKSKLILMEKAHKEIGMNYINDWEKILPKETFEKMISLKELTDEMRKENSIWPKSSNVFKALEITNPSNVSCVIIGQDPYHTPEVANGLAFASGLESYTPPSLRNISKELMREYGKQLTDNSLLGWAKQGVLLMNVTLTVDEHKPNSHHKIGWDDVTFNIIKSAVIHNPGCTVLSWGGNAKKLSEKLMKDTGFSESVSSIIYSSHPSGLSCYRKLGEYPAFNESNCFLEVNRVLNSVGKCQIDWFKS